MQTTRLFSYLSYQQWLHRLIVLNRMLQLDMQKTEHTAELSSVRVRLCVHPPLSLLRSIWTIMWQLSFGNKTKWTSLSLTINLWTEPNLGTDLNQQSDLCFPPLVPTNVTKWFYREADLSHFTWWKTHSGKCVRSYEDFLYFICGNYS